MEKLYISIFISSLSLAAGCSKTAISNSTVTPVNAGVPAVYANLYGVSSFTSDGTWLTIKSSDIPDHKSVYFVISNALYEHLSGQIFNGNTFSINPNSISSGVILL